MVFTGGRLAFLNVGEVRVGATDEDLVIARHAMQLLVN